MTLVELIVAFALIAMFATGVCQAASSAMKVYYKIRGLNQARQTADTLIDKITGEIEGALVGVPHASEGGEPSSDDTLIVTGSKIELFDRTGSHISMTAQEGELLIHYFPVTSQTRAEAVHYEQTDWKFDKKVYMGYEISRLNFSIAGEDYPENVLKVEMELTGKGSDTFTTTRYVECYNFQSPEDFDKIGDGTPETEPPETEGPPETEPPETEGPPETNPPETEGPPETETPPGPIDGEGFILVDRDDNISFVENDPDYAYIWDSLDKTGNGKVTLPKGIYEENGQYYLMSIDRELHKNNGADTLEEYWNMWGGNKSDGWCMKLDGSHLYTEADVGANGKWLKEPGIGSIYRVQGRYYVCTEKPKGLVSTSPSSKEWTDITEFVTELF